MLAIALSLLGGWILSWFGFKAVVITGMAQVFGVSITSVGYYFLFGMMGFLRQLAVLSRNRFSNTNQFDKLQEAFADLQEKANNLKNKR